MSLAADSCADAHHQHLQYLEANHDDGRCAQRRPADYFGVTAPTTEELDAGVEGPWRVDGDRTASWALRRLAEQQAEVDRVDAAADFEVAAIRAWQADATKRPRRSIDFLTAALIDYRHRLEDKNPRLPKTYKLPGGQLRRRAGRVSIKVTEEERFLEWAESHAPEAISRKALVRPLMGDGYQVVLDGDEPVGRVVTADGEVVPGVEVPAPADTYSVSISPADGSPENSPEGPETSPEAGDS
jgi:hypothetical protein